jgi:hypothetical protein
MAYFIKVGKRGINLDNVTDWLDDGKGFLITFGAKGAGMNYIPFTGLEADALRWYFSDDSNRNVVYDVVAEYQTYLENEKYRQQAHELMGQYPWLKEHKAVVFVKKQATGLKLDLLEYIAQEYLTEATKLFGDNLVAQDYVEKHVRPVLLAYQQDPELYEMVFEPDEWYEQHLKTSSDLD